MLRIDPEYPWRLAVVLLRCGAFDSFKSKAGLGRRVVKARASDMLIIVSMNREPLTDQCSQEREKKKLLKKVILADLDSVVVSR